MSDKDTQHIHKPAQMGDWLTTAVWITGLAAFLGLAVVTAQVKSEYDRLAVAPVASATAAALPPEMEEIRQSLGYSGFSGAMTRFLRDRKPEQQMEMRQSLDKALASLDRLRAKAAGQEARAMEAELRALMGPFQQIEETAARAVTNSDVTFSAGTALPALMTLPLIENRLTQAQNLMAGGQQKSTEITWRQDLSRLNQRLFFLAAIGLGLGLVLAGSLAWAVRRQFLSPLNSLARSLIGLEKGQLDRPVWGTEGEGEMGELARLLERLRQRFASVPDVTLPEEKDQEGLPLQLRFEGKAAAVFSSLTDEMSRAVDSLQGTERKLIEMVEQERSGFQDASRHWQTQNDSLLVLADHMRNQMAQTADRLTMTEMSLREMRDTIVADLAGLSVSLRDQTQQMGITAQRSGEDLRDFLGRVELATTQSLNDLQISLREAVDGASRSARQEGEGFRSTVQALESDISQTLHQLTDRLEVEAALRMRTLNEENDSLRAAMADLRDTSLGQVKELAGDLSNEMRQMLTDTRREGEISREALQSWQQALAERTQGLAEQLSYRMQELQDNATTHFQALRDSATQHMDVTQSGLTEQARRLEMTAQTGQEILDRGLNDLRQSVTGIIGQIANEMTGESARMWQRLEQEAISSRDASEGWRQSVSGEIQATQRMMIDALRQTQDNFVNEINTSWSGAQRGQVDLREALAEIHGVVSTGLVEVKSVLGQHMEGVQSLAERESSVTAESLRGWRDALDVGMSALRDNVVAHMQTLGDLAGQGQDRVSHAVGELQDAFNDAWQRFETQLNERTGTVTEIVRLTANETQDALRGLLNINRNLGRASEDAQSLVAKYDAGLQRSVGRMEAVVLTMENESGSARQAAISAHQQAETTLALLQQAQEAMRDLLTGLARRVSETVNVTQDLRQATNRLTEQGQRTAEEFSMTLADMRQQTGEIQGRLVEAQSLVGTASSSLRSAEGEFVAATAEMRSRRDVLDNLVLELRQSLQGAFDSSLQKEEDWRLMMNRVSGNLESTIREVMSEIGQQIAQTQHQFGMLTQQVERLSDQTDSASQHTMRVITSLSQQGQQAISTTGEIERRLEMMTSRLDNAAKDNTQSISRMSEDVVMRVATLQSSLNGTLERLAILGQLTSTLGAVAGQLGQLVPVLSALPLVDNEARRA